ncbi:MAG: hypothetical protein Tsb0014_28940 [Pleurocapsa sp.]
MKTNTPHWVNFFYTSLATIFIAIAITAKDTAFAQDTSLDRDQSVINGLFSPTAAQRFFEEGRLNLKREAKILENPERYFGKDLLRIDTVDMKIIDESGEIKPINNFPEDIPRPELK